MSRFSVSQFAAYKENFNKVAKRVLKKDLSTNSETLQQYERDLRAEYEIINNYAAEFYNNLDINNRRIIRDDILLIRDKLHRCFANLKIKYDILDRTFHEIDDDLNEEEEEERENNGDGKMAELTIVELLRLAAQTINKNYNGDPLGLVAFINSVDLLKSVACATTLPTLKQFILTKLEGKALEAVPQTPASIDEIINSLKANIKPDSSKVVAGRMMALRAEKTSLKDYTKQAEELADALKRSLMVEGISQPKAQEMAIDKTIEMCRASAKTDLVKSILASTTFNDPKDVVAKFVVESATETSEKQVLAFRTNNHFSKNRKGRNNYKRNGGNNFNRNYNQRQNNYNNNYNNNNNRNNNGRNPGHGGYRRNNNNYSANNGNNNRNVRYAENSDVPSGDRRGMTVEPYNQNQEYSHST